MQLTSTSHKRHLALEGGRRQAEGPRNGIVLALLCGRRHNLVHRLLDGALPVRAVGGRGDEHFFCQAGGHLVLSCVLREQGSFQIADLPQG